MVYGLGSSYLECPRSNIEIISEAFLDFVCGQTPQFSQCLIELGWIGVWIVLVKLVFFLGSLGYGFNYWIDSIPICQQKHREKREGRMHIMIWWMCK